MGHPYGDFTHTTSGGYKFEWTPFTPAIVAWQNAERYLKSAIGHLAEAQKLPGFALNGLADEHAQMIQTLKVLAEDAQTCQTEAAKVVKVLEAANTDYANANEASKAEYESLMATIDLSRMGRGEANAWDDLREMQAEEKRDQEIFPFDGKK
jgi:hypothetical protein